MDDEKDAGEVFAIPDLWAPAKCLLDAEVPSSYLFSQLELEGAPSPRMMFKAHTDPIDRIRARSTKRHRDYHPEG